MLVLGLVVIYRLFPGAETGNFEISNKAEEIQEAIMQDGSLQNSLYLLWKFSDRAKVKESIPFLNGAERQSENTI